MDTPPSCCPQPRPIRKTNRPSSQPSGVHTGVVETQQVPNDEEVKAAEALLNFTRHAENLMDQIFCQVMKIPLDEPLGDDEDEEEIEEGQEVDELQSSDSEDLLPNQEKEIKFEIPFKVPFNGAMRNLNG
ncbi:hypothetical protein C0993_003560, partial [Termitomyces sp. T159_Od127]